jgi:hypothetical protein
MRTPHDQKHDTRMIHALLAFQTPESGQLTTDMRHTCAHATKSCCCCRCWCCYCRPCSRQSFCLSDEVHFILFRYVRTKTSAIQPHLTHLCCWPATAPHRSRSSPIHRCQCLCAAAAAAPSCLHVRVSRYVITMLWRAAALLPDLQ